MQPLLTLVQLQDKAVLEDRLKAIAAQLIAAHRRQDHAAVIPYARQAGLSEAHPGPSLFMKAIQVFHPDRIEVLWTRILRARETSDVVSQEALIRLLELHPERSVRFPPVVDFEQEEEYGFDGDEAFADEDDWDPDAGTFYSAVKRELFGNLEVYPDAADLAKLEGELDLSDYDLHDLEGVEHCVGLSVLNLSRNNLDNIYPLKDLLKLEALDLSDNDLEDADALGSLVNLKELDLSANDLDDVAFLDRLIRLRYVDLTGNPVRNKAVLGRLEARGTVVIL